MGVYEYTQQIQEQIQSIQSIQVFGHLLSCRQDPCSIIVIIIATRTSKEGFLSGWVWPMDSLGSPLDIIPRLDSEYW